MADTLPYGCFDRAPYRDTMLVQDGWMELPPDGFGNPSRVPKWKRIPFRMERDCQYRQDPMGEGQKDPRCDGCSWKQQEQRA